MASDFVTEVPEVAELLEQLERRAMRRSPAIAGSDAMCEVCCEVLVAGARAGCAGCAHRYCSRCVGTYWEQKIFSGAHARLFCLFGGCGVRATDEDIAAVVPPRVFRRMLYFRARDTHAENPLARFCPTDGCWTLVTPSPPPDQSVPLSCPECSARMCYKCEEPLGPAPPLETDPPPPHVCAARPTAHRHRLLFSLWASTHTKSCPACGTRIQRSRGCAHMTCARCSAYFCWRCRGFLHADCPTRGRACVCDRLLTGAAYSGLVAVAIIGAPVILTGALIGGAPWLVYRLVKRSKVRHADDNREPYPPADVALPQFGFVGAQRSALFGVDDLRARARFAARPHGPAASDSDDSDVATAHALPARAREWTLPASSDSSDIDDIVGDLVARVAAANAAAESGANAAATAVASHQAAANTARRTGSDDAQEMVWNSVANELDILELDIVRLVDKVQLEK